MFRGDQLVENWRLATVRETTGDELATLLVSLLELRGLKLGDVDAAILSSVVPQLTPEYELLAERYLDGDLLVVGPGMKTGMAIRIERPQELGTDRLANAVAAFEKCGGACVVADFGTTINFDAVSAEGELLGAAIAPGVDISLEALHQRTAKLPKVELSEPEAAIGRDTFAAVRSGVVYGFAGCVDGIVSRIRDELGDEATAIATGGLAAAITPFCEMVSSFGLKYGDRRTLDEYLRIHPDEHPVPIQLFGHDPEVMREAAAIAAEHGADMIDINMGCPVRKVVKTGAGASLLDEPDRAVALARAAHEGSGLPVTVKLRSGQRPGELTGIELARRLAADAGVAAISLHPRHASQPHSGDPDYAIAAELVEELDIPVIVSGGLSSDERALE